MKTTDKPNEDSGRNASNTGPPASWVDPMPGVTEFEIEDEPAEFDVQAEWKALAADVRDSVTPLLHSGDLEAAHEALTAAGVGVQVAAAIIERTRALLADTQASRKAKRKDKAGLITASSVTPRSVEFLWKPWIPRGVLTMIDGNPGVGKSTLTLELAATVSRGRKWPDGTKAGPPGDVIVISGEDDIDSVIVPRLAAAGADLSRVHFLVGKKDAHGLAIPPSVPDGIDEIRAAVELTTNPRLLIIDPIVAHLDDTVKTHNDGSVRKALVALKQLAEDFGMAVVAVRHLNKGDGGEALFRGGGSIAFVGASRSAILVAPENPDDPDVVVMAHTKSNNGRKARVALTYRVVDAKHGAIETSKVAWVGTSDLTPNQLLGLGQKSTTPVLDDAVDWLERKLKEHPWPIKDLDFEGEGDGIAAAAIRRARLKLGVQITPSQHPKADGKGNKWVWTWTPVLPEVDES